MGSARIPYRNLNYIRSTKEPIKGHLLAEALDDISNAFGQLHTTVAAQAAATQTQVVTVAGSAAPVTPTGSVISVFGRTGVVTAQVGDYSFSQISGQVLNSQLPPDVLAKFAEFFK